MKRSFKGQSASKMMNFVIVALIGAVVFAALIPTIATQIVGATGTENVTGAASTLLGLTTLFVVIGFIIVLLGVIGFKVAGR